MDKMRPAITLLITLSVIASMIALMGIMFKYLDVARSKAEVKASIIQANLLTGDISALLRRTLGKKPSTNTMLTLFSTPLAFAAQTGEFGMSIACEPLANRVNISWLGVEGKKGMQKHYALAVSIFDLLADQANLREPTRLLEKIMAELKHKNGTTFGVQRRINKKKGIITFKRFQQILDDYRYETDDKNIYRMAWQKYFTFGHNTKNLDGDFITEELLALMYDVELQVVQEDFIKGELDDFLREIDSDRKEYTKVFSPKALPIAHCKSAYSFREGSYGFSFNYINRRVENFEFFGN